MQRFDEEDYFPKFPDYQQALAESAAAFPVSEPSPRLYIVLVGILFTVVAATAVVVFTLLPPELIHAFFDYKLHWPKLPNPPYPGIPA